jgi:hypothetical protein
MSAPGCVYCGMPRARVRHGRRVVQLVTCRGHDDLPALDPAYGLAETIARGAYPALELRDRAPSASRREAPAL